MQWLSQDGVISAEEARRTVARCAQAESAQHPLVRLAAVAMARASDGKPLDIESLTQWLAGRAGLDYLRIDPLKVDVGKVADTMSAGYAERHRVLPVQVTCQRSGGGDRRALPHRLGRRGRAPVAAAPCAG